VSKLIDRLNQIAKGGAQPIGFRAASGRTKSSPLLLIAVAGSDGGAVKEAREHASAILFNSAAAAKLASEAGDLPWGVYIGADGGNIDKLKSKGCDFIVFNADDAPVSLLSDEGMGRMVELTPGIADGLARSASQLPVDAVLVGGEPALSVKRLLVCQHMSNMVGKPLIARASADMSDDELRELWETGISGIAVDIAGDSGKKLVSLKETIDRLPASRRKRGGKPDVSLPYPVVDDSDIDMEEEE